MNIPELSRDNPRLLKLEAEYAKLNLFEQSVWTEWAKGIDIQNFRAEHGYMAQMWMMTEERYQNTWRYIVDKKQGWLLRLLVEDGAFGAVTFADPDGYLFGRDLLDSALEIMFLRQSLGWGTNQDPRIMDIGAGYGRLAHRFLNVFEHGHVACFDGVPLSTFLCDFYLKWRGFQKDKVDVIPLHQIQEYLDYPQRPIDLAVNTQSFSEMPLSAVDFWVALCATMKIPYFFLEPHSADLIHPHYVTSEPDGTHRDYFHLFEKHGYKLKVQQSKFPRELAPSLIYSTDFLLFERG